MNNMNVGANNSAAGASSDGSNNFCRNESLDWTSNNNKDLLLNRFDDALCNERYSDMQFLVVDDNVLIPAHRQIVGMSSPVLEALAYGTESVQGTAANGTVPVPVRNCRADEFKEVLRYVYTNDCRLTVSNAPSILLVAHFFSLANVEQKCIALLMENVSIETVCATFDRTHILDNELTKLHLNFIQQNTFKLFNAESSLFDLGLSALGKIMQLDELCVDCEVFLFRELILWAKKQCKKQWLDASHATNLRDAVEGRLRLIRLSSMDATQFGRCMEIAAVAHFFTSEEIATVFRKIILKTNEFNVLASDEVRNYAISRKFTTNKFKIRSYNAPLRKSEHKARGLP